MFCVLLYMLFDIFINNYIVSVYLYFSDVYASICTLSVTCGYVCKAPYTGPTWLSFSRENLGCPVHVTGRTKKIINQGPNGPLLWSAPAGKWRVIPWHPGAPAISNQGEVWSAWAPGARAGGTINFAQWDTYKLAQSNEWSMMTIISGSHSFCLVIFKKWDYNRIVVSVHTNHSW